MVVCPSVRLLQASTGVEADRELWGVGGAWQQSGLQHKPMFLHRTDDFDGLIIIIIIILSG